MTGLAPPVPYQWNVGDVATAALLDAQLYTGLTFLLNPPMFEAVQTATGTLITSSASSWTPINFADAAGIIADTYGGWSSSTPSRYTAQTPGWYWVSGTICFPNNATGNRGIRIAKNGNAVQGTGTLVGGAASGQDTAIATPLRKIYLNGTGDYIEVHGTQTSGSSLTTAIAGDVDTAFSVSFAHL
ncbi:hypothetical protein [Streptacidiphilus sp. MAP5-3]|uniref:hypothetical protein n=1 Tax=unclassified Streptacidiphilus TaxID=2643834 RepID=UPI003510EC0C